MKSFGDSFCDEDEICEFVDADGLKRKLRRKLCVDEDGDGSEWEVLDLCLWLQPHMI